MDSAISSPVFASDQALNELANLLGRRIFCTGEAESVMSVDYERRRCQFYLRPGNKQSV